MLEKSEVAGEKEFQEEIQQLGRLVADLAKLPGAGPADPARELVQLLMEVHSAGIERMLEVVFASGPEGQAIIDRLGRDPIVRNLLLLYSLHPEDLQTRLLEALEGLKSQLRKHDSSVTLISLEDGMVRLRVNSGPHRCGSTARTLRSMVEESIYARAPDLKSLEILGLDESASGFVPLESLQAQGSRVVETVGGG